MTTPTTWRVYAGRTFLGIARSIAEGVALFERYAFERKQATGETIRPDRRRLVPAHALTVHPGWNEGRAD